MEKNLFLLSLMLLVCLNISAGGRIEIHQIGQVVAGLPTGTTKVAYHSNDGTTGLQSCSSSSVTLSGVSPNSTVMLYRHDYIPYIAPLVLQNTDLENPQYVFAGKVRAGYNVDSGRTRGDVTVKSGADYEIEAAGEVFLGGGFSVERGASFSVVPSTYK